MQERADRRGRPITSNSDIKIRNLQQEVKDKNKVQLALIRYSLKLLLVIKVTFLYKSSSI